MITNALSRVALLICAAALTAACAGGTQGTATPPGNAPPPPGGGGEAPKERKKPTMDEQGGGAGDALCTLFTTKELADRIGDELTDGEVAGPLGSACQWSGTTDERAVFVQVQMAPPKYWSKPKTGYQDLSGIGKEAYSSSGMIAGFEATALTDDAVIAVSVAGTKESADLAADLLRTTFERL